MSSFFGHDTNTVSVKTLDATEESFAASMHISDGELHWHPWQITGNNLHNALTGGGKNDTVKGGGGDDVIYGGDGRDFILGDNGNFSVSGDDQIYGEGGDDYLWGEGGDDYINGGEGNDVVNGWWGHDVIDGGNGDDALIGWGGDDYIDGGNDNDRLYGGDGNDVLTGGFGDDTLDGGNPEIGSFDILWGGITYSEGNDVYVVRNPGYTHSYSGYPVEIMDFIQGEDKIKLVDLSFEDLEFEIYDNRSTRTGYGIGYPDEITIKLANSGTKVAFVQALLSDSLDVDDIASYKDSIFM